MPVTARRIAHQHGTRDLALSRYFALYLTQVGWLVLGWYLFRNSAWPSSCLPTTLWKGVTCSIHLADNRGWVESGLMTWLWTTPLLVGLELSRRFNLR